MQSTDELSVPQVAAYLNVNEETVRRNIRAKRLKAVRRGTQWFVNRSDLDHFATRYDRKTGKMREEL